VKSYSPMNTVSIKFFARLRDQNSDIWYPYPSFKALFLEPVQAVILKNYLHPTPLTPLHHNLEPPLVRLWLRSCFGGEKYLPKYLFSRINPKIHPSIWVRKRANNFISGQFAGIFYGNFVESLHRLSEYIRKVRTESTIRYYPSFTE